MLFRNKNRKFIIRLSAIFIALNLLCSFVYSQNNLVPNGSFENYSICPTGPGSINKATPWFQPNYPYAGPGGSSDCYNLCDGDIPFNFTYQYPRTGNGYAGIAFFFDTASYNIDKWREYIEVELIDSLKLGKKYCVRYYANKANTPGMSGFPVKQLQAVLTNDSLLYNDPNYSFITGVTPIMEADSIITDTLNWIPIETTYIAQGGERFLTIGNFNPGSLVNYLIVGSPSAPDNTLGYYLIDDVSIYEQPDDFAGNDTIIPPGDSTQLGTTGRPDIIYSWSPTTGLNNPNIANPMTIPGTSISYTLTVTDTNQLACTSVFTDTVLVQVGYIGIEELHNSNFGLHVYPNPFCEMVTFKTKVNDSYEIKIFDVIGKQLQSILFEGDEYILKNTELNNGIYFYEMINKNGVRVRGKVVKE